MEAGLAGTPYAIDPEQEATDTSLYLTAEGYDGVTVFIDEGFPEGTSYFSVRGAVDLQL
jgi:hypothetical protein